MKSLSLDGDTWPDRSGGSKMRLMPPAIETALHELRMRYRAAHTAYQACVRAITEATMSGALPSPALLEQEAKALGALTALRASLLAAMAKASPGDSPPDLEPR